MEDLPVPTLCEWFEIEGIRGRRDVSMVLDI
jgi:hypothetical protein